jgi:gliding motility-associated-like protein
MLVCNCLLGSVREAPCIADPLNESDFILKNASCKPTGSIVFRNASATGITFSWQDKDGTILGSASRIDGLNEGTYKLTYTVNGGPTYSLNFPIINALPNAATQNLVITCDESRIRVHADGFSGGHNSTYQWENGLGNTIETAEFADLTAGQYYLTITDENGCSSNRASIMVKATSRRPVISSNAVVSKSSGCSIPDGAITGMNVSSSEAGPLTYIWRNSDGTQVGDQIDLIGVPAGKYRLTTRLTAGACEAISAEIEVEQRNPLISSTNSFVSKRADCNLPNGGITGIKTNATVFRWIDVDGNTVANTLDMVDVKEGYYELIVSNDFGCQQTLGPFHVQAGNPPIDMQSLPVIKNDSCALGIGSILGARVIGSGIRYSWADESGKEISTDPDLRRIRGGKYILTIRNPSCAQSYAYTVQNVDVQLPTPVLEDKFVCSATDILIVFNETAPLYRIYDQDGSLLQESKDKSFMLKVNQDATYYGALANGNCESVRAPFKVAIGEAALKIPTSFSPNNDGTNDTWVLKGIEVYNTADVRIFNRYGNIVYHSTKTTSAFDGKKDGNDLPSGVYYYIIKLTNECNPFTGSVTILR